MTVRRTRLLPAHLDSFSLQHMHRDAQHGSQIAKYLASTPSLTVQNPHHHHSFSVTPQPAICRGLTWLWHYTLIGTSSPSPNHTGSPKTPLILPVRTKRSETQMAYTQHVPAIRLSRRNFSHSLGLACTLHPLLGPGSFPSASRTNLVSTDCFSPTG